MLDLLLEKVEVPKEVEEFTDYIRRTVVEFEDLSIQDMFFSIVANPPADAFQGDENKCDHFLTDVLEAIKFQANHATREVTCQVAEPTLEALQGIHERTKKTRDNVMACLLWWGMRNGSVDVGRADKSDGRLTGYNPSNPE